MDSVSDKKYTKSENDVLARINYLSEIISDPHRARDLKSLLSSTLKDKNAMRIINDFEDVLTDEKVVSELVMYTIGFMDGRNKDCAEDDFFPGDLLKKLFPENLDLQKICI